MANSAHPLSPAHRPAECRNQRRDGGYNINESTITHIGGQVMKSCFSVLPLCLPVLGCCSEAKQLETQQSVRNQPSDANPSSDADLGIDQDEIMAQVVEERLESWTPDSENEQQPLPEIRHKSMDIEGEWFVSRGLDGSALSIKQNGDDQFRIVFSTHGCLASYQLIRTGTFSDGVLTLNRPVDEYFPLTYKKLYAVRVGKEEFLLPSAAVEDFQSELSPDSEEVTDFIAKSFYVFKRKM